MKIFAIARNYTEHAKELGGNVPKAPVFFMKPDTALLLKNQPFYLPDFANEFHYETEIVIKINKVGKHIQPKFAHRYYDEITVGIDFTARDLQRTHIKEGLPWEACKSFDFSAPIGKFIQKTKFEDIQNINFQLDLSGQIVQNGNTKNMVFTVDELIAHISKYVTLKIGDLLFTGTPVGVGPVKIGDRLIASVEGETLLDFEVK